MSHHADCRFSPVSYGYLRLLGDPFGFRVELDRMPPDACRKLDLPFVGNQADFLFTKACGICDKEADLLGDGNTRDALGGAAEPPPVIVLNTSISWARPRRNMLRFVPSIRACHGCHCCHTAGLCLR